VSADCILKRHIPRQFPRHVAVASRRSPSPERLAPSLLLKRRAAHQLVFFKRSPGLQSVFSSKAVRTEVLDSISKRRPTCQFPRFLRHPLRLRTLRSWEQKKRKPSGAARMLIANALKHPEVLQEAVA
jgi:hypothetical protein